MMLCNFILDSPHTVLGCEAKLIYKLLQKYCPAVLLHCFVYTSVSVLLLGLCVSLCCSLHASLQVN